MKINAVVYLLALAPATAGLPAFTAHPNAAAQSSAVTGSEVSAFADPLGVWCEGKAAFLVGLENITAASVYVAVPKTSSLAFPCTSAVTLVFGDQASGSGGGCGCEGDGCPLCALPDSVVTLPPGERLTWIREVQTDSVRPGPGHIRFTFFWYGSTREADARTRVAKQTVDMDLEVFNTAGSCLVGRKKPG